MVSIDSKTSRHKAASKNTIDVSASSDRRQPALAEAELRVQVARIMRHGSFWQSQHAWRDREERNVTDEDILEMLTGQWRLRNKAEWDERHFNWKYVLEGKDLDGDDLTLVVALNTEEQTLAVVTKF